MFSTMPHLNNNNPIGPDRPSGDTTKSRRYLISSWGNNSFRFRARLRHHLSYLASISSIMLSFVFFRWVRGHLKSCIRNYLLSAIYSRKICIFHFDDCHLEFLVDVDVMRYRKWHHWKAWPRKYGDWPSRWNFVAVCALELEICLDAGKRRKKRCRDKG